MATVGVSTSVRRRRWYWACSLAVGSLLAAAVWWVGREPLYQGRTLQEWVEIYLRSCDSQHCPYTQAPTAPVSMLPEHLRPNPDRTFTRLPNGASTQYRNESLRESLAEDARRWQRAEHAHALVAIRRIGKPALPFLRSRIHSRLPAWKLRCAAWLGALGDWPGLLWLRQKLSGSPGPDPRHVGMVGLILLGEVSREDIWEPRRSESDMAFPECYTFLLASTWCGPDGIAARVQMADDPAFSARERVSALRWELGIPISDPRYTVPPLPHLAQCLVNPNLEISAAAVHAVCRFGGHPEYYAPGILANLTAKLDTRRWYITELLRSFGSAGQSFNPALQASLSDPDPWIRQRAADALTDLDPEAVLTAHDVNLRRLALLHVAELQSEWETHVEPGKTVWALGWSATVNVEPRARISPADFRAPVRLCLADADESVRQAAIEVLQRIDPAFSPAVK